MTLQRLQILMLVLLIGGCATAPAPAPGTSPGASGTDDGSGMPTTQAPGTPEGGASRPSPDQATLALLNQSERAAASGAIDEALSYAERAVRIDPRRADLWTRLARLELANEDPDTAIRYAHKAISLAGDRKDWTRDAWLVIADAKDALGQSADAAQIRSRWATARG